VTDFPDRFVEGLRLFWRSADSERELIVVSARPSGRRLLIQFDGVEDAASARELAGGELFVPEAEAVEAPEGFYYSYRIEGWRCEDTQGRPLGRVVKLEQTAGGSMLSLAAGGREAVSIPFTRPIVVSIEPGEQRIVVDPPEGLMDLGLERRR
jgi:16S rRNA processing protein RimM